MAAPTISRNLRMHSDIHRRVKSHEEERSAPCRTWKTRSLNVGGKWMARRRWKTIASYARRLREPHIVRGRPPQPTSDVHGGALVCLTLHGPQARQPVYRVPLFE